MDSLDATALARIQFALNIGFHILFPSVTIALAWLLVWFRVQYGRTGAPDWINDFALELPRGASVILKHSANGELKGLDKFEPDIPPVAPVFFRSASWSAWAC